MNLKFLLKNNDYFLKSIFLKNDSCLNFKTSRLSNKNFLQMHVTFKFVKIIFTFFRLREDKIKGLILNLIR